MFFKIGVLKDFIILTGRKPVLESLVPGLQAYNFSKKRPQLRCFPVNIAKLLRTAFWKTAPGDYFWTNETTKGSEGQQDH